MAKSLINIGSSPDDETGDALRSAGQKINDNFDEIYTTFGDGTSLTAPSTNSATADYATNAGIATVAEGLVFSPNITVGIVTATGFVSTASTTPVSITWENTNLIFTVAGIGSATLNLI